MVLDLHTYLPIHGLSSLTCIASDLAALSIGVRGGTVPRADRAFIFFFGRLGWVFITAGGVYVFSTVDAVYIYIYISASCINIVLF